MSKEKEQEQEQQQATVPDGSPSGITSPVILRANSREDIDQQFQDLKAKNEGHTLTAGAVARSRDDGTYILRVDII